jgi:hypothetical protein
MEKHFGFTGTQNELPLVQSEALLWVFEILRRRGFEWQHNGDCVGADWRAACLWGQVVRGRVHGHPPDIDTKRAFYHFDVTEDPKPYRERNSDIVRAAEVMVATPKGFQEETRSGTWMTIRMARKTDVPRVIVWPDGKISTEGEFQLD